MNKTTKWPAQGRQQIHVNPCHLSVPRNQTEPRGATTTNKLLDAATAGYGTSDAAPNNTHRPIEGGTRARVVRSTCTLVSVGGVRSSSSNTRPLLISTCYGCPLPLVPPSQPPNYLPPASPHNKLDDRHRKLLTKDVSVPSFLGSSPDASDPAPELILQSLPQCATGIRKN